MCVEGGGGGGGVVQNCLSVQTSRFEANSQMLFFHKVKTFSMQGICV